MLIDKLILSMTRTRYYRDTTPNSSFNEVAFAYLIVLLTCLCANSNAFLLQQPNNLNTITPKIIINSYPIPIPILISSKVKSKTTTTSHFCQLLGMNCATPTDFTFSLTGFTLRGGKTDKHTDGWGLAFYEGRGVRTFHDPLPASESLLVNFLQNYPIQTLNMMSHIRYATEGEVALENVHPFTREMWGILWCFAHNGDVPLYSSQNKNKESSTSLGGNSVQTFYNPVGNTDSEATFCAILNAIRSKFDTLPTLSILHSTIQSLCEEIVSKDPSTILNFLLMCGEHVVFAYSHPGKRTPGGVWNGLYYTIRQYPFSTAQLVDCDLSVDFSSLTSTKDRVAIIATTPLTNDEAWCEFQKGELILFDQGWPYRNGEECQTVDGLGHGLRSEVLKHSIFMGSGI